MSSVLPTAPLDASRVNPRISIFYGNPKVGKTEKLAELPNCLIMDLEKGAELISALRIPITSCSGPTSFADDGTLLGTSIDAMYTEIVNNAVAEAEKTGKKPKPPYKYIAVDTLDKFEDFCEVVATNRYKNSTIGKTFDGKSVLDLPQGAGYYHIREVVMEYIDKLAMICQYLILISHIKEKNINKGGIAVVSSDISLTGKLGKMVAAKADCIGYVFREPGNPNLMVNFETLEDSTMGTRVKRLAGRKFPFAWKEIFVNEDAPGLPETK